MKKKICMVVQNELVKGGIAAVVNGYRNSELQIEYDILFVESYKDGNKITKFFKALKGYLNFIKKVIVNKPELVHVHSSFGPSFFRKIPFIYFAYFMNLPIINHIHGADFEEFYVNATPLKKKLIIDIYNKCDLLIALSAEWKDKLSNIVSNEKIIVLENYSIIAKNMEKHKVGNSILFLGEIGKRKGCYDIPSIVGEVVKEFPDCKFILAGAGDIEDIRKVLKDKGLEKNVYFPGWVRGDMKDKLLRESDIFLLPSYNEGMPMSILDAMGYGLPIISSNIGGIPKIVRNNVNGFICEPGDIKAYSEKIVKLLTNKNELEAMGKNSYDIVKYEYSLEKHINNLSQIYKKIIQE